MNLSSREPEWRKGLCPLLVADLDQVIAQLSADEEYGCRAPTTRETLQLLVSLATTSVQLAEQISRLSPVGVSALFEASRMQSSEFKFSDRIFRRRPIRRGDLSKILQLAVILAEAAEPAAAHIRAHNMSYEDRGQGTGSNLGKDSDLHAIGYAKGFETVPFRNPKDKFAVGIIEALYRAGHLLVSAGSKRRDLSLFLDQIWADQGKVDRPNWDRVLRSRNRIAAKIACDYERGLRSARIREGSERNLSQN